MERLFVLIKKRDTNTLPLFEISSSNNTVPSTSVSSTPFTSQVGTSTNLPSSSYDPVQSAVSSLPLSTSLSYVSSYASSSSVMSSSRHVSSSYHDEPSSILSSIESSVSPSSSIYSISSSVSLYSHAVPSSSHTRSPSQISSLTRSSQSPYYLSSSRTSSSYYIPESSTSSIPMSSSTEQSSSMITESSTILSTPEVIATSYTEVYIQSTPEIIYSTYSYSQPYIITDQLTTFTQTIPTLTVYSYTSGSSISSSSSFQITPITTDLSYYQSVLSPQLTNPVNQLKSNAGKIAGGVVGGVVGLLLLALLFWFLVKRRKRSRVNDDENPFAREKKPENFFNKFGKKDTSSEKLNNDNVTPFYGASDTFTRNIRTTPTRDIVTTAGLGTISAPPPVSPLIPQRPGLPPSRSSEESLGLGGLSQNILQHQDSTVLQSTNGNQLNPTSYQAPLDQSDIINYNSSTPKPNRQMDVVIEEDNLEQPVQDESMLRHYKQSSRYNHIGLNPVPALNSTNTKIPPPVPRPRKSVIANNRNIDIYDTLNVQSLRRGHLSDNSLFDDESFDNSLLDISSIDDISSSGDSSLSRV